MIRNLQLKVVRENQPEVMNFIDRFLEESGCPVKIQTKIDISADEIFTNIVSYAYRNTDKPEEERTAEVEMEETLLDGIPAVRIIFSDAGIPYNPLAKEDPDVELPIKDRSIGGLGIFIMKNKMDETAYEYADGRNRFTMIKKYKENP